MISNALSAAVVILATVIIPPRFYTVQKIEVVGDVPAQVVISQSALGVGRDYMERDLQLAVARIRRLPFIYDARYSMNGETLVFEVEPVTRFSGEFEVVASSFPGDVSGIGEIGGRFRQFVGSGGVADVAITKQLAEGGDARFLGGGYAHYGIAGTRLFARAEIAQTLLNDDDFESDPNWSLTVGYPLTVRQTLSATAAGGGFTAVNNFDFLPRPLEVSESSNTLSLRWAYETSDDPFFARSGEIISLTPSRRTVDRSSETFIRTTPTGPVTIISREIEGNVDTIALDATKYWELGTQNVFFAGLNVFDENTDMEVVGSPDLPVPGSSPDRDVIGVTLGIGRNFFDWYGLLESPRHRVEFGVRGTRTIVRHETRSEETIDSTGISLGYILRRQYMTVRLIGAYDFD